MPPSLSSQKSKKRGLSLEEKRQRLLQIFFEKVSDIKNNTQHVPPSLSSLTHTYNAQKEFFQLKELEKIAPKEKGISMFVNILLFYCLYV